MSKIQYQTDTSIFTLIPLIQTILKDWLFTAKCLRLAKIYTFENDFLRRSDEMQLWIQRQGYPEDVINTEMRKMIFNGNSGKSSNKSKGVPFVLTYHPLLKKVDYIIRKHIHLFYVNDEVKKAF